MVLQVHLRALRVRTFVWGRFLHPFTDSCGNGNKTRANAMTEIYKAESSVCTASQTCWEEYIFLFLCTHTHTHPWVHTELYASGPSCSNCWEWVRGIGSWLSFLSNLALPDLHVKRSGENLIKEIEVTRSGESRGSDLSLWKRCRRLFFIRIQILVLHIVAASCVF